MLASFSSSGSRVVTLRFRPQRRKDAGWKVENITCSAPSRWAWVRNASRAGASRRGSFTQRSPASTQAYGSCAVSGSREGRSSIGSPLLRAMARAAPYAGVRPEARLRRDGDDPVARPEFAAAAVDHLLLRRDARFGDDACAQQHPVAGHAGDVALKPSKVVEEDFDRLSLALGPALRDIFVPVLDLLIGARQHGVGRPARLLPGPHEIGPPVRWSGAKLSDLGD